MVIKGSANYDPPQVHFLPLSLLLLPPSLLSPTPRFCRTKETRSEGGEGEKDLFWLSSSSFLARRHNPISLTHSEKKKEKKKKVGFRFARFDRFFHLLLSFSSTSTIFLTHPRVPCRAKKEIRSCSHTFLGLWSTISVLSA